MIAAAPASSFLSISLSLFILFFFPRKYFIRERKKSDNESNKGALRLQKERQSEEGAEGKAER